jgi:hypothetical protein
VTRSAAVVRSLDHDPDSTRCTAVRGRSRSAPRDLEMTVGYVWSRSSSPSLTITSHHVYVLTIRVDQRCTGETPKTANRAPNAMRMAASRKHLKRRPSRRLSSSDVKYLPIRTHPR